MNRWFAFLLSVLLCLLLSCGMRRFERLTSGRAEIELIAFTRLDEYPGVESDLLSTRSFVVELTWKNKRQVPVAGLVFDDLFLEPMHSSTDSSKHTMKTKLHFSMAIYRPGSDWASEYALPPSPFGKIGAGNYVLAVKYGSELDSISLPSPKVLPSVYYP